MHVSLFQKQWSLTQKHNMGAFIIFINSNTVYMASNARFIVSKTVAIDSKTKYGGIYLFHQLKYSLHCLKYTFHCFKNGGHWLNNKISGIYLRLHCLTPLQRYFWHPSPPTDFTLKYLETPENDPLPILRFFHTPCPYWDSNTLPQMQVSLFQRRWSLTPSLTQKQC